MFATSAWPRPRVPIPEGKPLTAAQEASIREEMMTLAPMLMSGGKTQQEAKLAAHAVGTCIGAAYSYDLTRQQADDRLRPRSGRLHHPARGDVLRVDAGRPRLAPDEGAGLDD